MSKFSDRFETEQPIVVDPGLLPEPVHDRPERQVNKWNLALFALCIGMNNIQVGFSIAGNNQTAPVWKSKFDWSDEDSTLFNSMINTASILGVVVGALIGGRIVSSGRRRSIILFNIIGAVGSLASQHLALWSFCLGKFLQGSASGVFSVAGPKFLDETVPLRLTSIFGTVTNTFLSFGATLCLLLAVFLPDDDDTAGQKVDEYWRLTFGSPLVF